jgi:hypothetical protein
MGTYALFNGTFHLIALLLFVKRSLKIGININLRQKEKKKGKKK